MGVVSVRLGGALSLERIGSGERDEVEAAGVEDDEAVVGLRELDGTRGSVSDSSRKSVWGGSNMDWILARPFPLPFPFALPFRWCPFPGPASTSTSSLSSALSVLLTASRLRLPSAPCFLDLDLLPIPNQLPPKPQPALDGSTLVTAPSATTLSSIVPSTTSLRVVCRRMLSIDGESETLDRFDMMDVLRVVCRKGGVGCG